MQDNKHVLFQMRFPQKLWYLLNLRTEAILWGGTGRTILLNHRILHSYLQCEHSIFKTTNISSFVRQLNLYGFRKVTSHLQDPLCNSSNPFMHEYVHDYFQYGRPELLNKITRKALAMKRSFKAKNLYCNVEQMPCLTPLQKARQALHIALNKAAHELYAHNSPQNFFDNNKFESEDSQDDYVEDEENVQIDWLMLNNNTSTENILPTPPVNDPVPNNESSMPVDLSTFGSKEPSQSSLMDYADEPCQQTTENFPEQFLSMPELDAETSEGNSGVELLAEFKVHNDVDQNIVKKISENSDADQNSLNCILPFINSDTIDGTSMVENDAENSDHYHGEWGQMFNDIIVNRPNQECGSELRDWYSQISKTIDLLNS